VHRFGLFVVTALLFVVPLAGAGGDKSEGDKEPKGEKKEGDKKAEGDKKPPPKKKLPPPRPVSVVASVEMKDGSSFLAEFRLADTLTIRTTNLGTVTVPLGSIQFVDAEGETQRIVTHALETFYGLIQNEKLLARMVATDRIIALERTGLKRIGFPDPPREFPMPGEFPLP
jgi:hypothetical protein